MVEFFGKALQILYLTVGIYPLVLVPLDIIPLPTADEICTERGQKQQPQYKRGDARYDRAVCEYSERADEKIEQRHPYKFRRALPGAGVVIRVLKLHYHLRVVGIRVVGAHIFLSQIVLIEQRNLILTHAQPAVTEAIEQIDYQQHAEIGADNENNISYTLARLDRIYKHLGKI